MTIFSDNPYDRRIEQLMTTVPNFRPRGTGFRFDAPQKILIITTAARSELLTDTMRQIRCPPFRKRFHEYIESEENPMIYLNERHRARFVLAARNVRKDNFALLSALYLLTADGRLWSCCKHHIAANTVFFEKTVFAAMLRESLSPLLCGEGLDSRYKAYHRLGSGGCRPCAVHAVPHDLQCCGHPPIRTRSRKGELP